MGESGVGESTLLDSQRELPEHLQEAVGRFVLVAPLLCRQLWWCAIAVIRQYIGQQQTPH